jgi:hypothetical protein
MTALLPDRYKVAVYVLMCWQVEQYKYTTVADFVADVEQLVTNARAYNKLGTGGEVATPAVIDIAEGVMAECQGWVQDPAWAAKAAELEAAIRVGVQAGSKGGGAWKKAANKQAGAVRLGTFTPHLWLLNAAQHAHM